MIDPRILPTILIIIDFMAAVIYMSHGDVKKAIYWVSAGVLTITVTY